MFNRVEPATFQRWLRYLAENAEHDGAEQVKRGEPRMGVYGAAEVRLASEEFGDKPVRGSVLEASTQGLMLRSRERIPLHAKVTLTAYLDDETFALSGTVVHCTQTVGAYKVGIRLNVDSSAAA